ncbi:cupin [Tenuifilaceae bacterium CYCD]|nr:cupin [Tenuifilaceae bacterium CYCD]
MKLITLESAEKVPFNLDGHKMFTSEKVELIHLNLYPNEEVAPHTNPFDVIFYILEGEGKINVDDESMPVKANHSLFVEKNKQRGMANTGSSNLKVLVFKIF